jgi:hypothetical protein
VVVVPRDQKAPESALLNTVMSVVISNAAAEGGGPVGFVGLSPQPIRKLTTRSGATTLAMTPIVISVAFSWILSNYIIRATS